MLSFKKSINCLEIALNLFKSDNKENWKIKKPIWEKVSKL